MKILGSEHVQTKELVHIELEKEKLTKELVDRNDEVVDRKIQVVELQEKMNYHVCVVEIPKYPQNPTEHLTKALTELQLSKGELKRVQRYLDFANTRPAQKEKQLEVALTNVEIINKNMQLSAEEVTELKPKLKGNMSLLEAI